MNSTENGYGGQKGAIDESLYSRQLYVIGHKAMEKMRNSDILICGLGGLGVEIAKNIILAGVKSVTLFDKAHTNYNDLSSQYYLSEEDIGNNRAFCCLKKLSELNTYVAVKAHSADLNEHFLKKFQVVVLTESSHEEQISIGNLCHSNSIKFIVAETKGIFGKIFCDFGKSFHVFDSNGQAPKSAMISCITNDQDGIVTTFEDHRHDLEDGAYVKFCEIKGMYEINGHEFKVKVLSPFSFCIGDTRHYGKYLRGGIFTEVKKEKIIDFESLSDAENNPRYFDNENFYGDNDPKLIDTNTTHIAFQALDQIKNKLPWPRPWNLQDAEQFLNVCKLLMKTKKKPFEQLNEKLLKLFACVCHGNLAPVQSIIGGLAAQEIMKACTGKFHPFFQYFYYDCREVLPENALELAHNISHTNEQQDKSGRYHEQVTIFGEDFQKKIENMKVFLVGTGALGCEYIKNFAMMGLSCGENGLLTVTDMDTIEKSNLNRQFLFRSWDVNKFKAEVAANAAKKMNPAMNISVNLNRIGDETEEIYNEKFFESLNVICNALDNVKTRLYIDSKCIQHQKPLIESGTLGTEANVQVVIPFLTEAYSSSQDPPEKSIPLCTLKIFPNAIEHTIQWARDKFEGLFTNPAVAAKNFAKNGEHFLTSLAKLNLNQELEELRQLKKILASEKCETFEDCVKWAREKWEESFRIIIEQLIEQFPPDQKTSSGLPFWYGPKRCPHALEFDATNHLHFKFVYTAANLKALMHGIHQIKDEKRVMELIKETKVVVNKPKHVAKIKIDENNEENDEIDDEDEKELKSLKEFLETNGPTLCKGLELTPIEFEKDDEKNLHIDFITSCSNLRAENYDIEPANEHRTKQIAGKIIPAIATTTSVVVGLDCIELLKIIQGHSKIELFRNHFINLALPLFESSEPMPVVKKKFREMEWSFWDYIEIKGEKTLDEFFQYFIEKHKLKVLVIGQGVVTIYSDFTITKEKLAERLNKKISEIWEIIKKEKLPSHCKTLILSVIGEDIESGEELEIPYIKYIL